MSFSVTKTKDYNITITDSSEFRTTSMLTKSGDVFFTSDECYIVDILVKVSSSEKTTIIGYAIGTGTNSLTTQDDGLYKIVHVLVPNTTWYNLYSNQVDDVYDNVYVIDNNKLYKKSGTMLVEVSIDTLLTATGNINSEYKYTFSAYNISQLFIEYAEKTIDDSSYTLKRDLIQMFMDCIRYCLTNDKFFEALRYIDKLYKCKVLGLLSSSSNKKSTCGCKK